MRVLIALLCMSGVCLAQKVDSFTQQEYPVEDHSVAKVNLTGTQILDIEYAIVHGHSLLLDLYLPKQPEGSPLVVWVHGGGWYEGSKSNVFISWLSNYGITVASINYRLVQIAKWPAQLHDCKSAVRWLRANSPTYGFNTDQIIMVGSSAGGHLAALMGTTGGVEELEGTIGDHLDQSSRVQGVVDYYGATDFILRSKTQPSRANNKGSVVYNLLGGGAHELVQIARQASAKYHITSDDPQFLIFHGDEDQTVLIDQSETFEKAYKDAGLSVTFHKIDGGKHGGFNFYSGTNAKRLYEFVKRHTHAH